MTNIHLFVFETMPDYQLLLRFQETGIVVGIATKEDLRQIRFSPGFHQGGIHHHSCVSELLEDTAWAKLCCFLSSFEMEERTTLQDIIETLVLLEESQSATIH